MASRQRLCSAHLGGHEHADDNHFGRPLPASLWTASGKNRSWSRKVLASPVRHHARASARLTLALHARAFCQLHLRSSNENTLLSEPHCDGQRAVHCRNRSRRDQHRCGRHADRRNARDRDEDDPNAGGRRRRSRRGSHRCACRGCHRTNARGDGRGTQRLSRSGHWLPGSSRQELGERQCPPNLAARFSLFSTKSRRV